MDALAGVRVVEAELPARKEYWLWKVVPAVGEWSSLAALADSLKLE